MPVRPLIRRLLEPPLGSTRRIPLGPAHGLRFAAEPAATASADLWAGLFESELAGYVRRFALPGTRCVDVGANSGYYTLVLAARTGVPVTAYEPDPEARRRLNANLERNPRIAPLVDLRGAMVGATSRNASSGGGSGDTVALDDDLAPSPPVGLLKIDVDGPEALVLRGGQRILTHDRPHVIVETHSRQLEEECAQMLLAAGYRPRVVTARRRLAQNRNATHNRWLVAEGGKSGSRGPTATRHDEPQRPQNAPQEV